MRLFIGGLIGLAIGGLLYVTLATSAGIIPIIPVTLLSAISFIGWLIVTFFTIIIVTTFAYSLATIGLLGPIAATPAGGVLPISPLEQFMRGLLIGIASVLNFGIWAITTRHSLLGLTIGIVLLITGFLAVFVVFSRSPLYQGILGWSSWLRPLSWLMTVPGFLLFLINLPAAIATAGLLGAVRFDGTTSTIESAYALTPLPPSVGGFDLGNFTFVLAGSRGRFTSPSVSTHETGHTLTVAAFGGIFGWINAIDENVPPFRRMTRAYGEMIPESHIPRLRRPNVGVWS